MCIFRQSLRAVHYNRAAIPALLFAFSSNTVLPACGWAAEAPSRISADDKAIKLDPFVISEIDNVGYSANSTVAGTRINTALRDIGASISIITREFLSDTAATNIDELLSMTTATEVGGVFGNFSGGDQTSVRPDQSENRENPQDNQQEAIKSGEKRCNDGLLASESPLCVVPGFTVSCLIVDFVVKLSPFSF